MKRLIKENSKFIIVMSIVIVLGIIGITYALKIAAFNPIGLNTTTGTINANITYDGDNTSTITNTDKMLPISDTLVDINTTDERVLKVSFNITGVSTNPNNTIYDISLRDINMDKELKSLYVKWRLYKNNTLLSEGNFSPSFDVKENNRLVLTEVQQDLTTNTDRYVYLMWISEVCTGDITTCDSTVNQNKYSNKTFNASIKIEASTKTKKELVRTKAVIGDVNEDGEINALDRMTLVRYFSDSFNVTLNYQQLKNADINMDGKVDLVDKYLIIRAVNEWPGYADILPDKPITDYILYGDLNNDGEITEEDATLLLNYLDTGIRKSDQALKNSDVNGDGKVNIIDLGLLQMYIESPDNFPDFTEKNYSLPNRSISKEYYTIQYGDVNGDGKANMSDVTRINDYISKETTLTGQEFLNADVNGDGKIDDIDREILYNTIMGNNNCTLPSIAPCKG